MIVVGALQQPPQERLDADDLEVLSAHFLSPDVPGDAVGFQTKFLYLNTSHSRKHVVFFAHIAHFRIRKKGGTVFGLKRHHPVCMRHIQLPQDQCLQDAENDDIGGNAERQDNDRSEGKARRAAQLAKGESEVLQQGIEKRAGARIAYLLLDLLDAAKLDARRAAGFARRHAGANIFLGQQFEVGANLLVEVSVDATREKEISQ